VPLVNPELSENMRLAHFHKLPSIDVRSAARAGWRPARIADRAHLARWAATTRRAEEMGRLGAPSHFLRMFVENPPRLSAAPDSGTTARRTTLWVPESVPNLLGRHWLRVRRSGYPPLPPVKPGGQGARKLRATLAHVRTEGGGATRDAKNSLTTSLVTGSAFPRRRSARKHFKAPDRAGFKKTEDLEK